MNVMHRIAWPFLALLAALPATAVDIPPPPLEDPPLFASPTELDRVGRILAPVMINGAGPFRFLLDTGANYSTISPELAEQLGLVTSDQNTRLVHGVTGSARVPTVQIASMMAGDLVIDSANIPVIGAPSMAGADGILGIAGLQRARILVDFRRDRVVISRSRVRGDRGAYLVMQASRMPDGILALDARVRGVRAKAILDTGAERTLGNLALLEAIRARRRAPDRPRLTDVYGATPEIVEGESELAHTIWFGEVNVRHVDITYGDFHIFKTWNLTDQPAMLIGMDVIGVVDTLVIDFPREEILVSN